MSNIFTYSPFNTAGSVVVNVINECVQMWPRDNVPHMGITITKLVTKWRILVLSSHKITLQLYLDSY